MIYIMSDIHGNYQRYLGMLKKIKFQDTDTLYILGDIIDRGTENIALLRDVMSRKNVVMMLGNHEYMMWQYYRDWLNFDKLIWFSNGGHETFKELKEISREELNYILNYIETLPLALEIEVKGQQYILVHGKHYLIDGAKNNIKEASRSYIEHIVWDRMRVNNGTPEDKIVIFGHTPTSHYQEVTPFKIWRGKGKIGIDCGMASQTNDNRRLACLRLDDQKEFYI